MTLSDFLVLFNLIILESLLSVDNAAVLAVMVKDLPPDEQPKALKYGIIGAFFFRGLTLVFASWLIQILWLKILGGAYLIYLVYGHYTKQDQQENLEAPKNNWFINLKNKLGLFWSTVILVEVMDIAFSIDNIFAAVAMTDSLPLIITGVCIGIVAMRFVAQKFTTLMRKYPSLENSAFIVILLLGIKLIVSGTVDYIPSLWMVKEILSSHIFDFAFSGSMILIFIFPLISFRSSSSALKG